MSLTFLHICNPSTPKYQDIDAICSLNELQKVKETADTVYLINVHLNWEGRKLNDNYGFDIANELRVKKKSKVAIIFYSPIQKAYFEYKSARSIKYKILFGSGSAFINSPFTYEELSNFSRGVLPLSNAGLHDVVTMLCNVKGLVIDKLNHDLKWGCDLEKATSQITPYLSSEQKKATNFDFFFDALNNAADKETFDDLVRQWIDLCTSRLTDEVTYNSNKAASRYKVLIIDDVKEYLDTARHFLSDDFEILPTTSCETAIQILSDDVNNEIMAVIADWRLYDTSRLGYWQPMQGYEVLAFAAKNGVRSLIALTSQAEYLVHRIRELLGIWFSLYKKQQLEREEQWQLFANMLADSCAQTNEAILSRPTSINWTSNTRKNLVSEFSPKEIYSIFRNDGTLSEIADRADTVWGAHLANHDIRHWLNELSTTYITFDTTKEMLVQRRTFLGLHYSGVSINEICRKMSRQDPKKTPTKSDITQLKNKLCLKNEDLSSGKILVEEKAWLRKWGLIN